MSDVLPWKFTPQQREVRVLPGETALAFYTATNTSDKDIIGVATYSVTPAQVAPYFSKIQCFCFEEQRLNAGETVDMPVFFYLDPDMLTDLNMKGIETVTLSYTFFSELPQAVRTDCLRIPSANHSEQRPSMMTTATSMSSPSRDASAKNILVLAIARLIYWSQQGADVLPKYQATLPET